MGGTRLKKMGHQKAGKTAMERFYVNKVSCQQVSNMTGYEKSILEK